jgi:hypothetical protein
MLPIFRKIWSLTSNYVICSIVIVDVGDTNEPHETTFLRRTLRGTSTGVSQDEIDVYGEITKIVQKRDTIAYLAESYIESRSYIKSFLEKGTSSTKPIPIIRR